MGGAAAPLPIPRFRGSQVVVPAPGPGAGNWAGAPSALLVDHAMYLAYRVRRPADPGRGVDVVVARSDDQFHFEPVAAISKELVGAESLERPALVRTLDGRWRLYLSCATPGTKHWRGRCSRRPRPRLSPAPHPASCSPATLRRR